ncbi:MAG: hypothetical protein U5N56_11050 [Candidatus Marinimicrobia bacterium]|nr:hypothetical protein [Candidatus Neomarinimicrobiota bacterium]
MIIYKLVMKLAFAAVVVFSPICWALTARKRKSPTIKPANNTVRSPTFIFASSFMVRNNTGSRQITPRVKRLAE